MRPFSFQSTVNKPECPDAVRSGEVCYRTFDNTREFFFGLGGPGGSHHG